MGWWDQRGCLILPTLALASHSDVAELHLIPETTSMASFNSVHQSHPGSLIEVSQGGERGKQIKGAGGLSGVGGLRDSLPYWDHGLL